CIGMAGLEECDMDSPEMGLWMKESAHGQGFGKEVVAAVAEWAHKILGKESFIYPVAVQNTASRRIAEGLHGEIIENRTSQKYDSVVYKIPWKGRWFLVSTLEARIGKCSSPHTTKTASCGPHAQYW